MRIKLQHWIQWQILTSVWETLVWTLETVQTLLEVTNASVSRDLRAKTAKRVCISVNFGSYSSVNVVMRRSSGWTMKTPLTLYHVAVRFWDHNLLIIPMESSPLTQWQKDWGIIQIKKAELYLSYWSTVRWHHCYTVIKYFTQTPSLTFVPLKWKKLLIPENK